MLFQRQPAFPVSSRSFQKYSMNVYICTYMFSFLKQNGNILYTMSSIHCFFTYIYISQIVSYHDIERILILLCKCILFLCSHDSPVPCHRHCLQCVAIARNYPVCMWLCTQKNERISWSALDNCKVLAVVIVLGWIPQKMDLKQSFVCRWFIREWSWDPTWEGMRQRKWAEGGGELWGQRGPSHAASGEVEATGPGLCTTLSVPTHSTRQHMQVALGEGRATLGRQFP